MNSIREIVRDAIQNGYLSVAAEQRLRRLVKMQRDAEEWIALNQLQFAVSSGEVRQESRESYR